MSTDTEQAEAAAQKATAWSEKTWLVTGSSSGFGRSIARALLARGGNVVATARDPGALQTLRADGPGRLLTIKFDVTVPDQVNEAMAAAVTTFGGVDVLVNSAGYGFQGGIEESTEAQVRHQFEVNFFGLAAVTRAALPIMRSHRSGFIVNFSSVAGFVGFSGVGWYCATKFAVEGLSEALAAEAAPLAIRVMIIEPGPFRTEFGGRSIRRPTHRIADYERVLARQQKTDEQNGRQPGDPDRAAQSLIAAMESDEPPARLLLGRYAAETAQQVHQTRYEEAKRWRSVARAADFGAA